VIDAEPRGDERGVLARTSASTSSPTMGWSRAWCRRAPSSAQSAAPSRACTSRNRRTGDKLVRCPTGAAFAVATDLREDLPTRLRWVGAELSAQNRRVLYVPEGFAQGYQARATKQSSLRNVPRIRAACSPRRALGTIRRSRSNGRAPRNGSSRIATGLGLAAEVVILVKRGRLGRTPRTAAGGFTEMLPPARAALPRKCDRRYLRDAPPPRHTRADTRSGVERRPAALTTARTPASPAIHTSWGTSARTKASRCFDLDRAPRRGPRRSWASSVSRLSLGLSSRLAKPLRSSRPRPGRVPQAGSPRGRWLVGCG
jgi:dTDP-4-dehydrorhamnose 3,5-epimerase-like enzyme